MHAGPSTASSAWNAGSSSTPRATTGRAAPPTSTVSCAIDASSTGLASVIVNVGRPSPPRSGLIDGT
ncbi:MAG: hypothetical protein ACO3DS_07040, partial [Phycisphaerales bacterium]